LELPLRRVVLIICLVLSLLLAGAKYSSYTVRAGFQPVSPEELKMTSETLAPGAPAIILYRQVDRDDTGRNAHEDNYVRIKVFTEEGRKYGNVEIPFDKGTQDVVNVKARSIKPDGSIVEFDGKVFEKSIIRGRSLKYLVKSFTLPDVQVGGILEYYYTFDLKEQGAGNCGLISCPFTIYDSHWILSEELFTKKARFSLKPFRDEHSSGPVSLRWSWHDLPPGADPKEGPDHVIRMEANNIPGFQWEDYMPPENDLKARVDFIYSLETPEKSADEFWRKVGKKRNAQLEAFMGRRKAMDEAVAQIVSPSDPPEVKLRKTYDRVQQIRNTSYELRRTEQEQKREREKPAQSIEDVWKRGYGDGVQLTWLYLGLLRAAGFEAYGVWVADRRNYFFTPVTMESHRLSSNVVLVKLNGKDLYLDPGAACTPFGMLAWSETGVQGLRLDAEGGTWVKTTLPPSSDSRIERQAKLKLSDTGDLTGKLAVTYTGLEAMYRRLDVWYADDAARKKFTEDALKGQIPVAAEAELTNTPDWKSSETPLVTEFDVRIPGWASNSGKRALVPAAVFIGAERHIFESANRDHPIYFEYPYEKADNLTIDLPPGWSVSSLPRARDDDRHLVRYTLKVENGAESLHLTRKLKVDFMLLEVKYYPTLRSFFESVRSSDEEQIVLQPGAASASN
jgi:hypothetical protein